MLEVFSSIGAGFGVFLAWMVRLCLGLIYENTCLSTKDVYFLLGEQPPLPQSLPREGGGKLKPLSLEGREVGERVMLATVRP